MRDTIKAFYDKAYFTKRLAPHGELQAQANLFKFLPYVGPEDNVVDFGCGGGFLLAALKAKNRIGIEDNPAAIAHAKSLGISEIFQTIDQVEDAWADCVISNHALEHVENPMQEMRGFFRVLKSGGTLIIVTPYDGPTMAYNINDPDRHLFGWSPSNLGNLARVSGFLVIEATQLRHRWPPKWHAIWQYLGPTAFHLACRGYGWFRRDRTQIRLVARKPANGP